MAGATWIKLIDCVTNVNFVVLYFTSGDEGGCRLNILNILILVSYQNLTVLTFLKAQFDALWLAIVGALIQGDVVSVQPFRQDFTVGPHWKHADSSTQRLNLQRSSEW
ncbi:hypothetical protein NDU88_001856 [Pleurodeles waltl]|uniref:Uncharacterized protein n=1 Tax=Pleurodeles waltl TaxID=8319 RepID=A0AAV7T0C5_PLEWA|nr:hypothetical protein NDU88_001856 [Pleurodeles waltl]